MHNWKQSFCNYEQSLWNRNKKSVGEKVLRFTYTSEIKILKLTSPIMYRVKNLNNVNKTLFVNGDVLYMYTELLNSGNTQYCFAFIFKL